MKPLIHDLVIPATMNAVTLTNCTVLEYLLQCVTVFSHKIFCVGQILYSQES